MSATEVLSALDRIHGTVSVIGSMNADYTVTAQRLPGPGRPSPAVRCSCCQAANPATRRPPQRASAQPCKCSAR